MANLEGRDFKLFLTHDKPIPDCFNDLTERAIEWGATHIWYVEEDMAFPKDTLDRLINSKAAVATIDYPVSDKYNVVDQEDGVYNKFGTGCTLIEVTTFGRAGREWRSDISYILPDWRPIQTKGREYGQQDVDFAQRCKQAGVTVKVVGKGNQYRVIKQGEGHTNQGWHEIRTIL